MIESILNIAKHFKDSKNLNKGRLEDRRYASGVGVGSSAVSLGSAIMGGGARGTGQTSGSTFDYLSTAENTIECYYQKLSDLRYYESHALTEKIIGIFRDYITQLWKEGSAIIDIPGEDPELVEKLNLELEGMGLLETLMKDLSTVIYYGSSTYEISRADDLDPNHPLNKEALEKEKADRERKGDEEKVFSESSTAINSIINNKPVTYKSYYDSIKEDRMYGETEKERAKRLVEETSPEVKNMIESTSPASKRGKKEAQELRQLDTTKLNPVRGTEAPADSQEKLGSIKRKVNYTPLYRLNKLKHPSHTVVESHRKYGRRYLVKATEKYHIPSNKHQIFYYGTDSMRLAEQQEVKRKGRGIQAKRVEDLIGYKSSTDKEKEQYKKLGINPDDPKKIPTRYELMEREISAGAPLFYHHLPKVRELYLKDLVVSILGVKDVIQPDILAMNFESGSNIDHAQELCNNLEDLLNKNSDYSIFNSAAINYNDLAKLLIDTVRVLPDIDGKLQSLNPLRTTTLQDKIAQIRMESKDLERDILSSLGIPVDLFEGNSSKWEVIKRSERLQSRVTYYINTMKSSIRRAAQSVFYLQNNRELKPSDFKVTVFNESDLDMATKTNKLQNLTELSQSLLNVVIGAERELQESETINKGAYFKLLKSNLKEIYPEIDDLINIDRYLDESEKEDKSSDHDEYGY